MIVDAVAAGQEFPAANLRRLAGTQPDKRAFTFLDRGEREGEALSYAELDRRARVIGRELQALGLAGRPVVLAYPPGLEFVAALFGCFYAGAVAVPAPSASHGRGLERLSAMLADADAAAILTVRSERSLLAGLWRAGGADAAPAIPLLASDEMESRPPDMLPAPESAATVTLLQYTSGSTGSPRGVMLTHGNLLHSQCVLSHVLEPSPDDTVVSWLPVHHDMGLIGVVLQTVHVGGSCVLMSPFAFLQKPLRWLQAISAYRAFASPAPSFAFDLCAASLPGRTAAVLDLSCWRIAICGGETIRARALERFTERFHADGFDARAFMPAYGLAEATLLATSAPRGTGAIVEPLDAEHDDARRRLVSCGRSWLGQEAVIVDPMTRRVLPHGVVGEIWLKGPHVAAGYWRRRQETAATFGATLADDEAGGTWLRTGDLGYLGPEGLAVTGRLKDMLVIRGVNIDPQDIEITASGCDECLEGASGVAFAIDRDDNDELVLLHESRWHLQVAIKAEPLAETVCAAIIRHHGIRLYDFVLLRPGSLPRTTSGKVQRHLCRDAYLDGSLKRLPPIDHPALGRCRPSHGAALMTA